MATLNFGDPGAAGRALLEAVDSDAPPLRVSFGAPVGSLKGHHGRCHQE
ncbi:hypothetical protein ACFCZV_06150 [Streptomyces hydrogenans]